MFVQQEVTANLQAAMHEVASNRAEAFILLCHLMAARHSEHKKMQKLVTQYKLHYLTK